MDSRCTGDTCTELKYQSSEDAMKCTIPGTVQENVNGCKSTDAHEMSPREADKCTGLTALPGNRMPF
jgi:hypothetical protein